MAKTNNWNWSTKGILVKCGGFSSQLANNVTEKVDGDPLWGSRFDATNPEAVIKTHLDFLRNGADIILTNTYQSSVEGFVKYLGVTKERGVELIQKSVHLAKEAKNQYLKETGSELESTLPLILGSIGPYGAYLHDGSEYSGSYADKISKEQLKEWHRTRIEICLAAGVDGLALETLPCQMEAEAVAEFVLDNCPEAHFWVSFQCKDEKHLASGESFAEAALSIWRLVQSRKAENRLIGIGLNCVNPLDVTPLLTSLTKAAGSDRIPLVVYSNRGEIYDAKLGDWTGTGEEVVKFVPEWLQLGARVVGGCCRVYPTDVLAIRKYVDSINIKP
ncbi:LOW QUALITY PROTEIN: homocysteine S-methyltransferase 2 [Drosophila eugracilis]|uniref:LOW QUALITY PROTEIN: homocysteine S-methyltransferase 2 n=1 Tax=Drosophila eugracilis TaxID=29029 RepID=UPI001BD94E93|nr:LOW QUALITY PROTEIN: homocysteine S-methyltransferase 2 [Drosophila eugracilis]